MKKKNSDLMRESGFKIEGSKLLNQDTFSTLIFSGLNSTEGKRLRKRGREFDKEREWSKEGSRKEFVS